MGFSLSYSKYLTVYSLFLLYGELVHSGHMRQMYNQKDNMHTHVIDSRILMDHTSKHCNDLLFWLYPIIVLLLGVSEEEGNVCLDIIPLVKMKTITISLMHSSKQ